MQWSKYQEDIFDWVRTSSTSSKREGLVVEAVAGSGKTTTIVEAAKLIPQESASVFLAFNKSIATELAGKLPFNVEARTLNSLGHTAVMSKFGAVSLDNSKTYKIVKELEDQTGLDGQDYIAKFFSGDICNIVSKCKAHGIKPYDKLNGEYFSKGVFKELVKYYGINSEAPDDVLYYFAHEALKESVKQTNVIDFNDQLYYVVLFDLDVPKYHWIIVDEAQDLSHINRDMLNKFLSENGKFIAVGDSHQAIYGFRGADSSSMSNIKDLFNCDELPLSTTYRCPKSVVEEAKRYVPEIECPSDKQEGIIKSVDYFNVDEFVDSDLVLCRNTAPLIKTAYKCITSKLPVRVLGRDIGKGLGSLVKKLAKKEFKTMTIGNFEIKLSRWSREEIQKAKKREQEDRIEGIQDKADSLFAIIEGADPDNLPELVTAIEELFSGDKGPRFSTVHRAKGLEANRVFILDKDLMPSKYAKEEWSKEQEKNIIYVAITRTSHELIYVRSKDVRTVL